MQRSSLNAFFSNEEGGCGAHLGVGIFEHLWGVESSFPQPMTHLQPFRRQSCFLMHSHWIQNPFTIILDTNDRLDSTHFNTSLHSFLHVF